MIKKSSDRQKKEISQKCAYQFDHRHFTAKDVDTLISSFIENNPLYKVEDTWLEIDYSHGYYDEIDIDVFIHSNRLETDEEYSKRITQAKEKKARDAERARKSRAAEKMRQEEKDRADFIRLTKKFTGEEIDPNSI